MSRHHRSPPKVLWGFSTECDDALEEAAGKLGVRVVGERHYGLAGKSAGAVVAEGMRSRWLRVTGLVGARLNQRRRAEIHAERLTDLPKPDTHRAIEWESKGVHWRAVLSTLAASPTPSEYCWLPKGAAVPPAGWFSDLRAALTRLQQAETDEYVVTREQVQVGIRGHFGPDAPHEATAWGVGHGDLHWKNLTVPNLTLLDWENWGLAPLGYDVARLMVYAAHVPQVQKALYQTFADEFDTSTGCVALLFAIGAVKSDIAAGVADSDLARPLERMAEVLVKERRVAACFPEDQPR